MKQAADRLYAMALGYPETYAESPWGELAIKCRKKCFLFTGASDERLSFSVKLPHSGDAALGLPNVEPTHYGMGKHGWVTVRFDAGQEIPWEAVADWLDESFRAVVPKSVVKALGPDKPPPKQATEPDYPAASLGPVVAVGHDPYRMERLVDGLRSRGVDVRGPFEPDDGALMPALHDAAGVVVDVGRSAPEGLEMASDVDAGMGLLVWVAGAGDKKGQDAAERAVPGAALVSREPPGDPEVVTAIVERLARA
jgi:predicted DNA-binding protein (MmcQ/YjbR family)